MDAIWRDRDALFNEFRAAEDKVEFCAHLPHIGGITKYHLAKDCGVDVAKPDVHLQRLASRLGVTVADMCTAIAVEAELRVASVDVVLWRACSKRLVNSVTGEFQP